MMRRVQLTSVQSGLEEKVQRVHRTQIRLRKDSNRKGRAPTERAIRRVFFVCCFLMTKWSKKHPKVRCELITHKKLHKKCPR